MTLLCPLCNARPQEQLHHKDGDHSNNSPNNRQYICTICHAKIHNTQPRTSELKYLVAMHEQVTELLRSVEHRQLAYARLELMSPEYVEEVTTLLRKKRNHYLNQITLKLEGDHRGIDNHLGYVALPILRWLRSVRGIGVLLRAKLISHIDISRSPTVASLWSYAGFAPPTTQHKFNHQLRRACHQISLCFVKLRNPDYFPIYEAEKLRQLQLLELKSSFGPQTRRHARSRAMRKMIKAFLKDFWKVAMATQDLTLLPEDAFLYLLDSTDLRILNAAKQGIEGTVEFRNAFGTNRASVMTRVKKLERFGLLKLDKVPLKPKGWKRRIALTRRSLELLNVYGGRFDVLNRIESSLRDLSRLTVQSMFISLTSA